MTKDDLDSAEVKEEEIKPIKSKEEKKELAPKKKIGTFLGVEVSAPAEMKNPIMRLTLLIVVNILLLVLLKFALR